MSNNLLKGEAKDYNKNLHPPKTDECPPKNRGYFKSLATTTSLAKKMLVFRGEVVTSGL